MAFDMYRIPPETWEKIFESVDQPEDLMAVSNTCSHFQAILYPTRCRWLFQLAFPSILEHILRRDVLQCRLVSKSWCYSVDSFLENNTFHRPYQMEKQLKHDQSLRHNNANGSYYSTSKIMTSLMGTELDFKKFWGMQTMHKLLNEAPTHPRCPIIGKSASIVISVRTRGQQPTVTNFLQTFGHHVWFLKIILVIRYPDPLEMLSIILNWLVLCPNLKMLDIHDETFPPVESHLESDEKSEANTNLENYIQNDLTEDMIQRLPKVETLHVQLNQVCVLKFQDILLHLFSSDNLQRLAMDPMPTLEAELPLKNVKRLKASFYIDLGLDSIIPLASQIDSLELRVGGPVNSVKLLEVLSHCQSNVQHFGLAISPNIYIAPHAENVSVFSRVFVDKKVLNTFPQLESVYLEGCFPSLNFLHGLRGTLMYLKIFVKERQANVIIPSFSTEGGEEFTDLLELLSSPVPNLNQIYNSNVWTVLPRLEVLTVKSFHRYKKREQEFTRDLWERFQQSRKNGYRRIEN